MSDDLPLDDADDLDDLLPDNLKKGATPLVRTPKQQAKAVERAAKAAEAAALHSRAQMLAQIVNLHIAGYSLGAIAASIGATEAEVERMLANETQAYVRTQPALRTYVRNYVSGKYTQLLEAVWDEATDKGHKEKLENSAQALRILKEMANVHGAAAPTQTEVKVEAAPEAVDRLVKVISAQQGLDYDTDIFDIPAEDIHEAVTQAAAELEVSGNHVEESDGDDEL